MYSDEPPKKILYCFGIHQPLFDEMKKKIPNITFLKGLPTMEIAEDISADGCHNLIVLDGLMHRVV